MFGITTAWGLDIGSSTIKAVKLHKTSVGVEVLDFDVVEIEYSEDDSTRPARVKAALGELVKRKKFGGTPVFFSIPGNQVFFRLFNLPAVGERKMAEIIQYEARQQVPFALEEVVWDYQATPTGPGGEMVVNLVAIRKEIVEGLLATMHELDLNIIGLAASPLALLNYVHYDIAPTDTVLILDAGAKVTDFVVLQGDSFWFRPLPVAGADITRVFEQKFRIPYAEAENLKLKMEESKQADKMFQVIEPTLRSLAGEIQRTAGFYKSLSRDARISRVLGIGHTFSLPKLAEFLSRNIEMEVELIAAPQRIAVSPAADTTWFAEEFPGMAAALGLGLQALGLAKVKMSLLPEAVKKEQRSVTQRWLFAGVAAAAIMLVISEYVSVSGETVGVIKSIKNMQGALASVAEMQEKVEEKGRDVPQRKAQLERWSQIGSDRGLYSAVLGKTLEVVAAHNRDLRDPAGWPARDGEVLLSQLYISWENPLASGVGVYLQRDPGLAKFNDPREKPVPLRKVLFVAAKFECRGENVEQMVNFEKELTARSAGAFKTVRAGPAESWRVGSTQKDLFPFFDWSWKPLPAGVVETKDGPGPAREEPATDRSRRNGTWVWMVWQYVVPGEQGPVVAGGKAAG